jgi:hypothetical protein
MLPVSSRRFCRKKKPSSPPPEVISIDEATQTRLVCILLVVQAVVSFRAVPRILELLRAVVPGIATLGATLYIGDQLDGAFRVGEAQPGRAHQQCPGWRSLTCLLISV